MITHTFCRQCRDHGASTAAQSQCCHRIKWHPNIQLLVLDCQLMKTKVQSYSNITGIRNIVTEEDITAIQEHRDGGRERINWTLASAQHDSIKLGAQHDSIKLGRIPIIRHKASKVPLHKMNLGCIWFLHWFHHGCLRVAVYSTCIKMQMSSCNILLSPTHHHKFTSSHFWLRLKNNDKTKK